MVQAPPAVPAGWAQARVEGKHTAGQNRTGLARFACITCRGPAAFMLRSPKQGWLTLTFWKQSLACRMPFAVGVPDIVAQRGCLAPATFAMG